MVAVLCQERSTGGVPSSFERGFGRYQRIFFILLVAFACSLAVSLATPKEAQAASGWYETRFTDGSVHWCFWVQRDTHYGWWDGCQFEYGGWTHYDKYSNGQILVWHQGQWWDRTAYWRGSPFVTNTISFSANRNPVYDLINSLAGLSGSPDYAIRSSKSGSSLESKNLLATGAAPVAGMSQLTEPTQNTQTTETSRSAFPWKVAQDDSSSFMYSDWRQVKTSKAMGGSYRVSSSETKGAFFEATGRTDAGGDTMELITATGPKMGKAKVIVVNLATAKVAKNVTFDLRTSATRYKVTKKISGLTPHKPYALVVLSANGRPVVVDAVGYEAHGDMCHSVVN